jgi:hypothetical protein
METVVDDGWVSELVMRQLSRSSEQRGLVSRHSSQISQKFRIRHDKRDPENDPVGNDLDQNKLPEHAPTSARSIEKSLIQ